MSIKGWNLVMLIIIVTSLWCLNFIEKDNVVGVLITTVPIVLAIVDLALNNRG